MCAVISTMAAPPLTADRLQANEVNDVAANVTAMKTRLSSMQTERYELNQTRKRKIDDTLDVLRSETILANKFFNDSYYEDEAKLREIDIEIKSLADERQKVMERNSQRRVTHQTRLLETLTSQTKKLRMLDVEHEDQVDTLDQLIVDARRAIIEEELKIEDCSVSQIGTRVNCCLLYTSDAADE